MKEARQEIGRLLEQAIGLRVTSIGDATFERVLGGRMKELGIPDLAGYAEKLKASPVELKNLVEAVVVPETWFFRDQKPFAVLEEHIGKAQTVVARPHLYRILSLPCSSGEEPYSIAMTLLGSGLPQPGFHIDAVDISEQALARARRAVYRKNSFRSKDLSFRGRFFRKNADGYELKDEVKKKVRFIQGNILHQPFIESLGRYDIVFCRNILIYFNQEAQRQAIAALERLLLPSGLLFTGHAEASLFLDSGFVPTSHDKAFAFRRKGPAADQGALAGKEIKGDRVDPAPLSPAEWRAPPGLGGTGDRQRLAADAEEERFRAARRLADGGRLREAARCCEEYLEQHGPSARWYYLLGVIRDSEGEPEEAVKLLRKAVYLDPGHLDSLTMLAFLAERAGDPERAANYKRRARKVEQDS